MADAKPDAQAQGGIFAPVVVSRASTAIVDQIRSAIVSGRLEMGARLPPERTLAEQFGVSRVTVRDALRGLEAMGLIEVRVGARGGAFVTVPSGSLVGQTMSDMMLLSAVTPEDIVEARLMVELGTVSLACARGTDEDLARLRALCERGQAELAAKTYTRELSWEFHSLLAEAAHNPAVDGLTHSFRSTLSMHPVRVREGASAHAQTVEEHLRILEALERRDAAEARREIAAHLLRGTGIEDRAAPLLESWGAADARPRRRAPRRAAGGKA
ncbi:MAG: GntR family transcriptional regulator, transcriptional repressor for pyruvate dehydrogenase complex [Solirubrobacteraceae bacterium]|nr:GntR family transcriptional regulator, transcriptional repressor for pyruvate dehydrogenase complex [Solirubrobacteraceae bacterium]MEA2276159.1 GntR family transcriptional regulator, transcriptional repressor for pyruvate dehydrogenase complex [Solirubrobacteraceae bacterium]MEA2359078.1 GntR family transcriptional regulator, transcriptional repressor for pyruvate dehydrogenase complex [Solirubrobacteraceae bacterium]MEA2392978.1 GntR family transcriptional regulator, transcriptional repress